eukprot:TRINITY_DN4516_c0_g1_i1.p1 TRINITY_DN4516_c0_g1~~TRINITY_DN4516_c0_g1_i1.p1  ORF type:complete len:212 (-),score=8.98 TRINITY_DN4516_c0_g1_i1:115-750(-)
MGQLFSMDFSSQQHYNIVFSLGDSLTEGYYINDRGFRNFHPYTTKLDSLIQEKTGDKSYIVFNSGVSGETCKEILNRFESNLKESLQGMTYTLTHAVILAGTNDMGYGDATQICNTLQSIYELAFKLGFKKVVVVTVPQTKYNENWYLTKRAEVNKWIKQYQKDHSDKMYLVDIESAIEYNTENFGDRLHFSPAAYDYFGQLVFDTIVNDL